MVKSPTCILQYAYAIIIYNNFQIRPPQMISLFVILENIITCYVHMKIDNHNYVSKCHIN